MGNKNINIMFIIGIALIVLGGLATIGVGGFAFLLLIFIGIFLVWKDKYADANKNKQKLAEYETKIRILDEKLEELRTKYEESGFAEYETAQDKLTDVMAQQDAAAVEIAELNSELEKMREEYTKACKQTATAERKLSRLKELNSAFIHMAEKYTTIPVSSLKIEGFTSQEIDELIPSVELKIHSMDSRDLLKTFKENDKTITELTDSYRSRYTTKTNQTIYDLIVIALRAELQNILHDLKYQKLDQGVDNVKSITEKYLNIACGGNQQIAPTITKFIGELEYLFTNAVKIEYNYYIRREQARQEQLAIREQMRQEAEDRRALEQERKRVENEEAKFKAQIDEVQNKLSSASDDETAALKARLLELEAQLSGVIQKKDEIANLQNGKAGNVYIISNLGSFGENVFKIGMTRRIDPQDRIDELGSASVPFGFDVHSFIFSDDAVELENRLHRRLDSKRVNKVNMRKEFFNTTLDELEALTHEISPTAEFNRTMAAEEFRQSLSVDTPYTTEVS